MHTIIHGDCLEELKKLDDSSVDAVITDPPYGLSNTKPTQVADVLAAWVTGETEAVPAKRGGFMGKDWDSFVPPPAVWAECMRVLKPGGHMAVFAGARTQDLMGLSIRLAGFEIRDTLGWIYGSGFPKSMDVSKAIDKAAGEEREVIGAKVTGNAKQRTSATGEFADGNHGGQQVVDITAPATDDAKRWDGWGTALKPAIEPIILARKPLVGTVANNVLAHGVGGLNIDACRVETSDSLYRETSIAKVVGDSEIHEGWDRPYRHSQELVDKANEETRIKSEKADRLGRFPANVLLDEHAAKEMDKQSGNAGGGFGVRGKGGSTYANGQGFANTLAETGQTVGYGDSGGASRFFPVFKYQAKAPKRERPVIVREDGSKIQHPTVKPLALMEWLITLITPEGGLILDPFAGTGTTLQAATNKGFHSIGIEADTDYIQLIHKRLEGGEQSTRSS